MVENEYKQRLVAILHADVVGYSRLMSNDEAATVKTLEGHREAVIQTVNQYHGNIIDMAGDSVLANFSSVVSAVQCSVELQKAIEILNDQLPVDHKMQFRIGVNLGDIIVNQDAIYGDGVNVAARIQALAEPGGICISGAVYDSVARKLPLSYKSIGEQHVKNIAAPVHVYRILSEADSTNKVFPLKPEFRKSHALLLAGPLGIVIFSLIYLNVFATRNEEILITIDTPILASDHLNKPSIAVLPFKNLSDETEQEYFADGITDDLITDLTKVSGLLVISRDSSSTYKDQELDVRQLSKKLNARYILEGSVRRSGGQIRINSKL
ncbi:MAG: adenylate/guanylate cyclase domain-containing protein, partial [Gammaproteobacteria bacterium]|nr:adenylate/guanylate cyclase domain-containing protein [Gammaproteobacteria bacterium]